MKSGDMIADETRREPSRISERPALFSLKLYDKPIVLALVGLRKLRER